MRVAEKRIGALDLAVFEQLADVGRAHDAAVERHGGNDIAAEPERLDELFPTLKRISVDYALMEPASRGATGAQVVSVGLAIAWRDVGGYLSLAETLAHDEHGNAVEGRSVTMDTSGCVLVNTTGRDHVLATIGLTDTLVVATPTATLAARLEDAERVKQLVDEVRTRAGAEFA